MDSVSLIHNIYEFSIMFGKQNLVFYAKLIEQIDIFTWAIKKSVFLVLKNCSKNLGFAKNIITQAENLKFRFLYQEMFMCLSHQVYANQLCHNQIEQYGVIWCIYQCKSFDFSFDIQTNVHLPCTY